MRWMLILACLAWGGLAAAQEEGVLEAHIAGKVEPLDLVVQPADYSDASILRWRGRVARLGTGFMRLHISAEWAELPTGTLLELDAGGEHVETLLVSDIPPEGRWSTLLPSGEVVLSLTAPKIPSDLSLAFDKLMYESDLGMLFSTWGGIDETVPVNDPSVPESLKNLRGPVARLSFFRGGEPRNCTGFMVAETRMVTNEHCVADKESCDSMVAVFGYERDPRGRLRWGKKFRCKSAETLRSDFQLDVALVELVASPGPDFGVVRMAETDLEAGAPLALIQHRGGKEKSISFIECGILETPVDGRAELSDLTHSCDSAEGSSGAPLFAMDGAFVGLHHYGFETNEVAGWADNRAVLGTKVRDWITAELQEIEALPSETVEIVPEGNTVSSTD